MRLHNMRIALGAAAATLVVLSADAALVGHWDFEAGVADAGANALGGTALGGAAIASDPTRGNVLALDGVDDYVEVPHQAALDLAQRLTVSMWIYPDNGGPDTMLSKGQFNETYGLRLDDVGTLPRRVNCINFHGVTINSTGVILPNKWTHVAVTFDQADATGADTKFYINGVLTSEVEFGAPLSLNTTPLRIGYGNQGWSWWKGKLDDVRLYDTALAAADVATLAAELVGNWTFDTDASDVYRGLGGTAMGGAAVASDPTRGNVLALNGLNDYVEAPHNAVLSLADGVSVSAWFKGGPGPDAVLAKGAWNAAYGFRLDDARTVNAINFSGLAAPDGATSTGVVNPAVWNCVTITFNRGGAPAGDTRFYVNGELDSTRNVGAALDTNTSPLKIGYADAAWSWWKGSIDDVSIWRCTLTPGLVRAMHRLSAQPDLRYNAADFAALLAAYRAGPDGSALVGRRRWIYATGLAAAQDGTLNAPGARAAFELVLDAAAGAGLAVVNPSAGTVFIVR